MSFPSREFREELKEEAMDMLTSSQLIGTDTTDDEIVDLMVDFAIKKISDRSM